MFTVEHMVVSETAHYLVERRSYDGHTYFVVWGDGCYNKLYSLEDALDFADRCESEFY